MAINGALRVLVLIGALLAMRLDAAWAADRFYV
jgi:hypothetical protein